MDLFLFLLPWVGGSILVGLVGKSTKAGFWIPFILSLLLSPLTGIIIVLMSGKKKPGRET
jgi:hypothetical protein